MAMTVSFVRRCASFTSLSSLSLRSRPILLPSLRHLHHLPRSVAPGYQRTLSTSGRPSINISSSSPSSSSQSSVDRDLAELLATEEKLKAEAKAKRAEASKRSGHPTAEEAKAMAGGTPQQISVIYEAPAFWKSIGLTKKLSFTGFFCSVLGSPLMWYFRDYASSQVWATSLAVSFVGFNLLTTPVLHMLSSPYIIRLELCPKEPLTHVVATTFKITGSSKQITFARADVEPFAASAWTNIRVKSTGQKLYLQPEQCSHPFARALLGLPVSPDVMQKTEEAIEDAYYEMVEEDDEEDEPAPSRLSSVKK